MEQIFYAPDIAVNSELPEEESQHCVRVLRMKEGDKVTVTDGRGFFYDAVLLDAHPKHCSLDIVGKRQQKPFWNCKIHIAVAPTKNMERMEWFVEKATELGVDVISFLRCRYSERREIKIQRLEKIAVNAMKQSKKATLPLINEMVDLKDFIRGEFYACKMIAHCAGGEKKMMKEIYPRQKNVLMLIGPEGDFDEDEISKSVDAGFVPVSLGESRLRTETAALVACSTIHILNQL